MAQITIYIGKIPIMLMIFGKRSSGDLGRRGNEALMRRDFISAGIWYEKAFRSASSPPELDIDSAARFAAAGRNAYELAADCGQVREGRMARSITFSWQYDAAWYIPPASLETLQLGEGIYLLNKALGLAHEIGDAESTIRLTAKLDGADAMMRMFIEMRRT